MNAIIFPEDIFKPADEVTWRDINGELVVLKLTSGEYYSFNQMGRLTWLNVSEGKAIENIISTICLEYDVTRDQAQSDVINFVNGLLTNELIHKLTL